MGVNVIYMKKQEKKGKSFVYKFQANIYRGSNTICSPYVAIFICLKSGAVSHACGHQCNLKRGKELVNTPSSL